MRSIRPLLTATLLLALVATAGCDAIFYDLDSLAYHDGGGRFGDDVGDIGTRDDGGAGFDAGPDTGDVGSTDDAGDTSIFDAGDASPDADASFDTGPDADADPGFEVGPDDIDGDGARNEVDNCPALFNPSQADLDGDGDGDLCDDDIDGDGYDNAIDNCPNNPDPDQSDLDGDGQGNPCDDDDDGDGVPDTSDNCPATSNANQADFDSDGVGDACGDADGDGILDGIDNCPSVSNPDQINTDATHPTASKRDALGDACDDDDDGDGLADTIDNCVVDINVCQWDDDQDGKGNSCDADIDGDGVDDASDNCPQVANTSQEDADMDGVGDACEPTYGAACAAGVGTLSGNCDLVRQDCGDCRICSTVLVNPATGQFGRQCGAVGVSQRHEIEEGQACETTSNSKCAVGLFCHPVAGSSGFCRRYCWRADGEGCQPGEFCRGYGPPEIGYCSNSC